MKTVILCGGYGTRIRDVADNVPKPMVPIGAQPILWHIMKYYSLFGNRDFVLCLGYKGETIRDYFVNYYTYTADITVLLGKQGCVQYHTTDHALDWSVTMAETGLNALTGTRIRRIRRYVQDEENFFLTYGDGLGNVDLDQLLRFHKEHGRVLTVTGVRPPGRFGEMAADSAGRVLEFNEKPQSQSGWISGGFFVCRREIFDYLQGDENVMLESGPMNRIVKDNQLMMYEHQGFWHPMDTARDHALLIAIWEKGEAPWTRRV